MERLYVFPSYFIAILFYTKKWANVSQNERMEKFWDEKVHLFHSQ